MTLGASISVSVTTLVTVVIPNELRGLCLALLFAASSLFGLGIAPVTVSELAGIMGAREGIGAALASVCVVTSGLGAAAFIFARRYFSQVQPL